MPQFRPASLRRSSNRRRPGPLWVGLLALALFGGAMASGQHSHATTADSPLACAVCAVGHHRPLRAETATDVAVPARLREMETPGPTLRRLSPVVLDPHRARAPPSA